MEQKLTRLGGSLLVPSVQELAKQPLKTLPPRHVRTDQDPPFTSPDTTAFPQQICHRHALVEVRRIHEFRVPKVSQCMQRVGSLQELVEKVKKVQVFFNLPMEEKKCWQQPGDLEGFGQPFVVSEEQKLDWADMVYIVTLPTQLRKPHLFANLPLPLRNTMEAYSRNLKNLAIEILGFMAKALKMEPNDMKLLFEEGMQGMRMNHYPPCPQPDLVIELTPHSDSVGLTKLQVNEMEGLQVKKDGIWVPVKPLLNAFIVSIGDVLEIVTNGVYQSIEHRATVNSVKERLSIATFYSPKLDSDMGPAPSLVSPENPAMFCRIGTADHFKGYFSRELGGKSYLDVKVKRLGASEPRGTELPVSEYIAQ